MQLLDGKKLAFCIKVDLIQKINTLKAKDVTPTLAVIIVGCDPASQVYVTSKRKQCEKIGIDSRLIALPSTISQNELNHIIQILNKDNSVHGILVQLPLPPTLSAIVTVNKIYPHKDVDGLTEINTGKLIAQDKTGFIPCTPQGIMHLITETGIVLKGKNALVIGRSMLVGLPTAHLLMQANCTVTVAHSHTQNLELLCQSTDILIAACGQPHFIKANWIKPGATIIDVGIHRNASNMLIGDVDTTQGIENIAYLSPVPGGVGPLTVAFLLSNTVKAANYTNI